MAHERIHGEDIAGNLIIQWNDEGNIVSVGLEWDDPDMADPGTGDVNTPDDGEVAPSESVDSVGGVIERQVEYGLGGRIEVPVAPYRFAPYYNEAERRWSIYLQMDRYKINGLIRTLRRARNKAFGADE